MDWEFPDDDAFTDYPRMNTASKKKIMGLNAAKLYDIPVPPEYQLKDGGTPGAHEVFAGEPEEHAASGA
jgi:hypothetical protein